MQWHLLRASVVVDDRSGTLFEEVHPRKHLAAFKVHEQFVKQLAMLVPVCQQQPIVITDAGFRTVVCPAWHNVLMGEARRIAAALLIGCSDMV